MLSSFDSGVVPALQSLALCIMQTEAEEEQEQPAASGIAKNSTVMDTGSLFGAFSLLQATGQMIIGVSRNVGFRRNFSRVDRDS